MKKLILFSIIISLFLNLLLTFIFTSYYGLEKHHDYNDTNKNSINSVFNSHNNKEVNALKQQVQVALDRIVTLKVELLHALDKLQHQNSTHQSINNNIKCPKCKVATSKSNKNNNNNNNVNNNNVNNNINNNDNDNVPYLMIIMPTVPRRNNASYLLNTLAAIRRQVSRDPSHPYNIANKIKVVISNNADKSTKHYGFEEAKSFYNKDDMYEFSYLDKSYTKGYDIKGGKEPSHVQQQTLDIINMLKSVSGKSKYLLIMEDDFYFCPFAFNTIEHLLSESAVYFPNWITIKISYGLNGILMHNDKIDGDVNVFADYLLERYKSRPPDHIYTEWAAGETPKSAKYKNKRPHIASRYNLLDHGGEYSSLRDSKSNKFAQCFEELVFPVLFEIDAFKKAQCDHSDMWPCPAKDKYNGLKRTEEKYELHQLK